MKKGLAKKISSFLATVLTVTSLAPNIIVPKVMADSKDDMEYAISMMNKYATITSGDFCNSNHSMAPIAVGKDFSGNMSFTDNNNGQMGYLATGTNYDLVVGGKILEGTIINMPLDASYKVAGYDDNGFKIAYLYGTAQDTGYTFHISEGATVNGYKSIQVKGGSEWISGVYYSYDAMNEKALFYYNESNPLPFDFARIKNGFTDWSKMVNDYCTSSPAPEDVIYLKPDSGKNLTLKGTDNELNIFNVDVTKYPEPQFEFINIDVPEGSKVIINVVGDTFGVSKFTYNGEGIFVGENHHPENNTADIRLAKSVVINCANATTINGCDSGNLIAPMAAYNGMACGETNGFIYCKDFDADAEFHGKNLEADFNWLPLDYVRVW